MANTTNLNMPFIEAAQAQKHVTHNAALRVLDAVVMLSVLDRDLDAPPVSPAEGDRYLVASPATGGWSGQTGKIAAWQDGAWTFYEARKGWTAWVADEGVLLVFDGAGWTGAATKEAAFIGIGTSADAINKLTVASEAVLFNHDGNGVQVKLNKNASGENASFLFQTGFSGRAEIGCLGDDNFVFKTSQDGAAFNVGLTLVGAAAGVPRVPGFTVATLPAASAAGAGAICYVSDTSSGPALAFSDGSTWRYAQDIVTVI